MKNSVLNKFSEWMNEHTSLSESSIEKYTRAVNTISNDMLSAGIINNSLLNMSLSELDLAVALILVNPEFITKNQKGKRMYSNGLKQYRYFVLDTIDGVDTKELEIVDSIKANTDITKTEKEALIKSRIGQGKFRKSLFEKYDGKCVVTRIDLSKLLIASHIKPWSVSENDERLSPDNGILLSADFDRLFDSGLITFTNDGSIVVSSFVNDNNRTILGLDKKIIVNLKSTPSMIHNLEYHRDIIFVA